jgi:putative transposase
LSWERVTIMNQRVRFVAAYLNEFVPVNELCLQFKISRKTGYKWIKLYEEYESEGSSTQYELNISSII